MKIEIDRIISNIAKQCRIIIIILRGFVRRNKKNILYLKAFVLFFFQDVIVLFSREISNLQG